MPRKRKNHRSKRTLRLRRRFKRMTRSRLTASHKGMRRFGREAGYQEGYIRGRAAAISEIIRPDIPFRPIHILYVSTGKGFPYPPLDEGMTTTLQGMVSRLTIANPKDPVAAIAVQDRPDLVIVLDGMEMPVEQVIELRANGIRTAIWLTDDPYYTDIMTNVVRHYDYVFTLEMNSADYYRSIGCPHVNYLPFGMFPGHYKPRTTSKGELNEVCFIGSAYWNRVHYFAPIFPALMSYNSRISGIWWDRVPGYEKYEQKISLGSWMSPEETADTYNQYKIVINMHRAPDDLTVNNNTLQIAAASPNPRTFEIMGCATLQLTDVRSDLVSFYTPGVEIETYHSPQEMMQKIDYYLKHEAERREIALRGLARTLREHTYAHRLNQLLATVFGN